MVTPLRIQEYRKRREEKRQALPKIECACGCGVLIPPVTIDWKPSKYAHGHNPTNLPPNMGGWNKGKPAPWASKVHKGKKLSKDELRRRKETRLKNNGGVYQQKRGWKHNPKTLERMKVANKAKALKGKKNPFYGKKHTPETRAQISAKLTGELNPGWNGGASTLPYGPEFTRRYKRQIRERDNYTCQRCGKKQEDHWRALEVHHIDHNKKNNHPENMTTVCGSCNVWLSYHRNPPLVPLNRR